MTQCVWLTKTPSTRPSQSSVCQNPGFEKSPNHPWPPILRCLFLWLKKSSLCETETKKKTPWGPIPLTIPGPMEVPPLSRASRLSTCGLEGILQQDLQASMAGAFRSLLLCVFFLFYGVSSVFLGVLWGFLCGFL